MGEIASARGPVPILLQRVAAAEGAAQWKIAPATVARIPRLYDEFGYGVLGEMLPERLFAAPVFEVRLWQWLGLLVVAAAAWGLSWFLAWLLLRLTGPVVRRTRGDLDDRLLAALAGPSRLLLFVLVFALATRPLGLAVPVQDTIAGLSKAAGAVALTWFLLRVVDVVADVTVQLLEQRDQPGATQFVPLGRKTIKVILLLLAVLATLDNFGLDVTALIAGLGVGGLAVALAAQKTVENLFGGVTVLADRPVRVGDFCRFGDKLGIVEEIGLRSTRIRTLGRTVVTVPNAEFSSLQLENFAVRDRMWLNLTIGVRYETSPEQMRFLLAELRRMLIEHPRVMPDLARVRFVSFGAFSLDLEVFAYVDTTDWAEFLAIREDAYLRIMDIVAEAGTGFAFPSQTAYLGKDELPDPEKARAAEEAVAKWREDGELPFPDFLDETREAMSGRLDYPPKGSVQKD